MNAAPAYLTKALKALLQFYLRGWEEDIWVSIHALCLWKGWSVDQSQKSHLGSPYPASRSKSIICCIGMMPHH